MNRLRVSLGLRFTPFQHQFCQVCVFGFLCCSQTKNVAFEELVYPHLWDSGQLNVYFLTCRVNSFALHGAHLIKSKHATPIRQYKFVRPRAVNRNWEWRGTPNSWKHALKSKHNLWNTRKRLRRCKNWWVQIKTRFGRNCFISKHIPSGPWEREMSVFSHSWNPWACISSSFIFPEHEKVAWPVMTTDQLVRVVTSCSHMARVHSQNHLISCQVPARNFKHNLELFWTEGFKLNEFLWSRFLMLKQRDYQGDF